MPGFQQIGLEHLLVNRVGRFVRHLNWHFLGYIIIALGTTATGTVTFGPGSGPSSVLVTGGKSMNRGLTGLFHAGQRAIQ